MVSDSGFESTSGDIDRDEIIGTAKGSSVSERMLFRRKYHPRVDDWDEEGGLKQRIPDVVLRWIRNHRGYNILNRPVFDFLESDEQPHFIFWSTEPIEVMRDGETENHTPQTSPQHLSIAVVTDTRILFLIGTGDDDKQASCTYSEIDAVYFNSEVADPYFSVHAGARYTMRNCEPTAELAEAAKYVNKPSVTVEESKNDGQSRNSSESSNWWDSAQSQASDAAEIFQERIDTTHLLKCSVKGVNKGRKVGGGKGAAVGFIIGAGYSVYSSVAGAEDVDAPDPEDVADTASKWQREAAKSGDTKTEWMATSLGVASEFAISNGDGNIATVLSEIDPQMGVAALESGMRMAESTDMPANLLPADSDVFASLAVENLRQPPAELEQTVTELFDENLMDILSNVSHSTPSSRN